MRIGFLDDRKSNKFTSKRAIEEHNDVKNVGTKYNFYHVHKLNQQVSRALSYQMYERTIGRDVTKELREKFDEYIIDIESATGLKIGLEQRKELGKWIVNHKFTLKSSKENSLSREDFVEKKPALISEWQTKNDMKWPRYHEDVYSKHGKLHRKKGWKYDAHHIIELSFGGPNEWWNVHPASSPEQHLHGIHRDGGVASQIFGELSDQLKDV